MLVQKTVKCIKCNRTFTIASPYRTYHCSKCGKLIGAICDGCISTTLCSCGGKPIDKTGEWAAKNRILF